MTNLKTFNNPEFGSIRTTEVNGTPYFVGKDVAEILGYSDLNKAISMHVDDEDKKLINESGLYSLILSSKLPNADESTKQMFGATLKELRKLNEKVEADKPKVLFADAVTTAKTSILIGDLAKLLKQNGIETGQKRLFDWLRTNGYLIKGGSSKNMPTQKDMELGLFEVKETTINNPDGSIRVTKITKVTGKGQAYFINKFLGT